MQIADIHEVAQGDLPIPVGGRHEDPGHCIRVVPPFAGVAHAHHIALAPFHRLGQRHTADSGLDIVLYRRHGEPVPGDSIAADSEFKVGLSLDPFGKDSGILDPVHFPQQLFQLQAERLDRFQVGTFDLDAHLCTHTRLQHHDARFDRL